MKLNSSLAITKTKNCTKAPRAGNIGTMKHTVKKNLYAEKFTFTELLYDLAPNIFLTQIF